MTKTLFLSVGALTLAACTGGYDYAPAQQHQAYAGHYAYGSQSCGTSNCAPGAGYSVAPGKHAPSQPVGYHAAHHHGAPQTVTAPRAAYGSAVPGALAGLRGTSIPRNSYTYGELGGVAYDPFNETYGIQGRVGYQSANFWGVEAEGSYGLSDRTEAAVIDDGINPPVPVTVDVGVDYSLAGFGRVAYPVSPRLNLVGRVGYHTTELVGEAAGVEVDVNVDGVAYGGGVEYALSPRSALRLDYTSYDGGDDVSGSLDSAALSYQVRF